MIVTWRMALYFLAAVGFLLALLGALDAQHWLNTHQAACAYGGALCAVLGLLIPD